MTGRVADEEHDGGAGKTHQDVEDLAILRAMPGTTVLAPADAAETRALDLLAERIEAVVAAPVGSAS
ncbi:hypothetical protein ACH9EU_06440 [Kocuria sp. M1R5S2]|uniref:hypothetical protein n=1 Tax=Kocuria rhizosphaerae TaxID=3376285 RepID=UPI00379F1BD8